MGRDRQRKRVFLGGDGMHSNNYQPILPVLSIVLCPICTFRIFL